MNKKLLSDMKVGEWFQSTNGTYKYCLLRKEDYTSDFIEVGSLKFFTLDNVRFRKTYSPTNEEKLAILPYTF